MSKGQIHNEETRKKMARSAKALWKKRRATGFRHTEIARKNIGDAARKRCSAPDYVHNLTGRPVSDKTRKRLSEASQRRTERGEPGPMLGKKHSPETLQRMAEGHRRRISKVGIGQQLKACATNYRKNPTPQEKSLQYELRKLKISYQFQYIFENRYVMDFFLPQINIFLECDGSWHRTPKGKIHDAEQNRLAKALGFKIVRIQNDDVEHDLKKVRQRLAGLQ